MSAADLTWPAVALIVVVVIVRAVRAGHRRARWRVSMTIEREQRGDDD